MFKNRLACVGFVALAAIGLLAVPGTSEGGPFGLRGAGPGTMYTNTGTTVTSPDVSYSQPYSADTNPPRVGFLRRIFGRNNYAASPYVAVPAGSNTATTSTSGYKPGDVPTGEAITTAPQPAAAMPVESNPQRVGLLRRLFNRRSTTTTATPYVYIPAGGDTMTTSTSGYRPGDATTVPSSSNAFVYVDQNPPPRMGLLRRLFNRNYNQPTPNTYVAAGGNAVTYSTSGFRPGDVAGPASSTQVPARLRIAIPSEKAEIWIEGEKSEQATRVQEYLSPPLTPGKQYFYEVRARWTDPAGKEVERTRSFPIVPGQPVLLDFTRTAAK
ncbi:MAG TPA: hypothetical protein VGG61_15280 [Gemmataceae bacterium]|jgi:uncharacterized protein (TIGR03000 family)